MRKTLPGLFRVGLAVFLLYLSSGLIWTILTLPVSLDRHPAALPALIGFVCGLVLFVLGNRFLRLYVFGHELTHWLAAKCFFRQTEGFRVSGESGSVAVERPNVWIVLTPYFVPIYTLVWVGLYGVVRFWHGAMNGHALHVFYAGLGVTYAFHTALTAHALGREQKDLTLYGRFFSLSLILCCNAALLFAALALAGGEWGHAIGLLYQHLDMQWQFLRIIWDRVAP